MAALRVLPPADFVGAVEAIGEIVPLVRRLLDDRCGVPARRRRLLLRPVLAAVRLRVRAGRADDAGAVRRAGRRPGAAGQEGPARPGAVAGGPARRAELGLAARARPAGLARGVRGDRAAAAGDGFRRAGRRQRPRLPAPRDVGRARGGGDRPVAVRPGVRARRDGRAGRREDVQEQGQPGARLRAARVGRGPGRAAAGAAGRALPGRPRLDGGGAGAGVRAAGALAGRGGAAGRPRTRRRCSTGSASGSPTTWTRRPR